MTESPLASLPERGDLVVRHMPLARKLARLLASRRNDAEELSAVAYSALVEAASQFDTTRGAFTPYAQVCVQRALTRHLARNEHPIFALSERAWRQVIDARRLPDAPADETTRRLLATWRGTESLNAVLAGGDTELVDVLAADGDIDGVLRVVTNSSQFGDVGNLLDRALRNDRQLRQAVEMRFGVNGHRRRSYCEIALDLGISPATVRRRVHAGVSKLRRWTAGDESAYDVP